MRRIIEKVVKAYGGRESLQKVKSIYAKGRIAAFAFGEEGMYVRHFERGRRLRVDIDYPNSSEHRILNGSKGYEGGSEVTGDRYLAMVYQYKQLDLPYGLLHNDYRITYEGQEQVDGNETEVLGLIDKEGPPMKIYIDPKTFYLVKVSGEFLMGGGTVALSAVFAEFRKVDGIYLPCRITNFADGQRIAETHIREYEVNTPMTESLFDPR
ncbi:MAG: hypothetical protein ACM3MB_04970 [Acidobacteriota bacterium]